MAINGDGFFSVQQPTAVVDNVPVFNSITDYTRRGDFQVNANGNLVNGAGYYLMGVTVDPNTGNPTGNVPQVLQFQNNFIPAQATTAMQYAANLPTEPKTRGQYRGDCRHASPRMAVSTPPTSPPIPCRSARRRRPSTPTPSPALPSTTRRQRRPPITASYDHCRAQPQATRWSTGSLHGDTITVDGTTITFVSHRGYVGNQHQRHRQCGNAAQQDCSDHRCYGLRHRGTGQITLDTGTAQDLNIVATTANATTALSRELGSASPPSDHEGACGRHQRRHGSRHRQRPDDLHQRIHQRRRGDGLQCGGDAGEPAIALGQDRQRFARRRAPGHLEPVLSDQYRRDGYSDGVGQYRHELHLQCQRRAGVSLRFGDHHSGRDASTGSRSAALSSTSPPAP